MIETIVAVVLVSLFVNGLLLTWYFIDIRERSVEAYWNTKQELELAMEITQKNIREFAHSDLVVLTNGISFNDVNGEVWSFIRNSNNSYQLIRNGKAENLILNRCSFANFIINDRIVQIELGIEPPVQWNGDPSQLQISSSVYLRNY